MGDDDETGPGNWTDIHRDGYFFMLTDKKDQITFQLCGRVVYLPQRPVAYRVVITLTDETGGLGGLVRDSVFLYFWFGGR